MMGAWSLAAFVVVAVEGAPPPGAGQDPLAQHVFAPDLVMRYATEIGLDEKQRAAIKDAILKMQSKVLDVQWEVQAESEKMARLLQASPVDETAVLAQADKVMALEREVKRTHLSLLIRVKNVLTDAQREKLKELRRRTEGGP
jgi:Spy/CpxP family protein refolding chaperone